MPSPDLIIVYIDRGSSTAVTSPSSLTAPRWRLRWLPVKGILGLFRRSPQSILQRECVPKTALVPVDTRRANGYQTVDSRQIEKAPIRTGSRDGAPLIVCLDGLDHILLTSLMAQRSRLSRRLLIPRLSKVLQPTRYSSLEPAA